MVVMEGIWSNIYTYNTKNIFLKYLFFTLYIKLYSNPFHPFHKEKYKNINKDFGIDISPRFSQLSRKPKS